MKKAFTHYRALAILAIVIGLVGSACSSTSQEPAEEDAPAIDAAEAETSESESIETTNAVAVEEPDPEPAQPVIEFDGCDLGIECAIIQVPLDYGDPDGPTVDLAITRTAAKGDRSGILFVNPGGPGFGAKDMVRWLAQTTTADLRDRFDIVGIDPRGPGGSNAISCNTNWKEDTEAYATAEDGFEDDIDRFVADFADLASVCEEKYGVDYLASLTTENAARDMETVRVLFGDEPLNYFGASYGTAIGSVYATLFPDSIRSMVLDGAVPTNPPESAIEPLMVRIEEAFGRLDVTCDLWEECGVRDVGLLEAIEEVRNTLKEEGSIGPLEAHTFEAAVGWMASTPFMVLFVTDGLAQALQGDGNMLADIGGDALEALPDEDGYVNYAGANPAIVCADGWNMDSGTAAELLGQAERTAVAAPNVGPGWEWPCDLWPVTGSGIPAVNYTGSAPILVIGTEYDTITPLAWSEALADELGANATLLTWGGSAHAATFSDSSRCIDSQVVAFLTEGIVPADGARCEQRGFVGIDYNGSPVEIAWVTPGGTAEAAGVLVGDIILEAHGQAVVTDAHVPYGGIGEPLVLKLQRGDETLEVSIVRATPIWEMWRTAE